MGKGPITSELHTGLRESVSYPLSPARWGCYSFQFIPLSLSQLITFTTCSQHWLSPLIIAPFFTARPHTPLNAPHPCPSQLLIPMSQPPTPAFCTSSSHLYIFLHPISESPPQPSFPVIRFHFVYLAVTATQFFHISTLSTASTAQVCNKFQLTHFLFLPSIYPDAFYQFPP